MVHLRCRGNQFSDIAAVIFDKDGTLADGRAYLIQLGLERSHRLDQRCPGAGDRLRRAFGLKGDFLDPFGLLAVGTRQENAIAAATYLAETGCSWQDALHHVQDIFHNADQALPPKAASTPPFPGITALLEHLSEADLKLAVLSSDSHENVTAFLEQQHLQHFFQGWMGAKPGKPSKPDPILVEDLCQQLGVPPAAAVMIGDTPGDLQMARAAKMAGSIGVTWGWGDRPSSPSIHPDKFEPDTATIKTQDLLQSMFGDKPGHPKARSFPASLAHFPRDIRGIP
jgi:phosphoglycolate phosphatase